MRLKSGSRAAWRSLRRGGWWLCLTLECAVHLPPDAPEIRFGFHAPRTGRRGPQAAAIVRMACFATVGILKSARCPRPIRRAKSERVQLCGRICSCRDPPFFAFTEIFHVTGPPCPATQGGIFRPIWSPTQATAPPGNRLLFSFCLLNYAVRWSAVVNWSGICAVFCSCPPTTMCGGRKSESRIASLLPESATCPAPRAWGWTRAAGFLPFRSSPARQRAGTRRWRWRSSTNQWRSWT